MNFFARKDLPAALPAYPGKVVRRSSPEKGWTRAGVTYGLSFAHRACFLDGGRVVEAGPPAVLFGTPRSERLAEFLRAF